MQAQKTYYSVTKFILEGDRVLKSISYLKDTGGNVDDMTCGLETKDRMELMLNGAILHANNTILELQVRYNCSLKDARDGFISALDRVLAIPPTLSKVPFTPTRHETR